MEVAENLCGFIKRVLDDPAIGPSHISLYLAIQFNFRDQDYKNPISIFSRDLMKQAKISAIGTYYKCINDLKGGGYIRYTPSYNPFLGSLIYIIPIPGCTIANSKNGIVKYFLLPGKQGYRVIKVQADDIEAFRKKYQKQIMLEANSIAELLIYFSAKLEDYIKN